MTDPVILYALLVVVVGLLLAGTVGFLLGKRVERVEPVVLTEYGPVEKTVKSFRYQTDEVEVLFTKSNFKVWRAESGKVGNQVFNLTFKDEDLGKVLREALAHLKVARNQIGFGLNMDIMPILTGLPPVSIES